MSETIDLFGSTLTTALRGGTGIRSVGAARKPSPMLRLYDIENCPFCRLAREALTELDLDAEIYPCPKRGERFRPVAKKLGGKALFPYLVDEGAGVAMYESMDIVRYLYQTYGGGELPLKWRFGGLQVLSSSLASGVRINRGMQAMASRQPEQRLELFSFEGSPYARRVRELLCQMEISYVLRNCGRTKKEEWVPPLVRDQLGLKPDSELNNRRLLLEREGRIGIPYLYDANTDTGMFESADIIDYLKAEYAA